VNAFADTSFLFAFYFPRDASERAVEKVQSAPQPLRISALVHYEFLQAVWFEVWRRANEPPHGMNEIDAQTGLAAFAVDVEQGLWDIAAPNWDGVIREAERLTVDHTPRHGARTMDILHIATARQLGATEFLTFDTIQHRIAEIEGMTVSV
jgi:predicted nucleic acid-binding protein